MIKEDIPYIYIFNAINGPKINETAIYHIKILTQHEMASNMFYK